MSKPCKKIKNPCKICLGPVTRKNGLQCQGFCQCWVHYACLNYTPGKIKDIKAGIIHVNCPCPDCSSTQPKEYRTDEPFSCTNLQCPANIAPKCGNTGCPINEHQGDNMRNTGAGSSCPLGKCGKECKDNSNGLNPGNEKVVGSSRGPPCKETSVPLRAGAVLPHQIPTRPATKRDESCPSGCSLPPGDIVRSSKSSNPMPALEQMCNTVGQLTNQINDLMHQMKIVVQATNNSEPGRNPKDGCPKSCYCPGNPGKRC